MDGTGPLSPWALSDAEIIAWWPEIEGDSVKWWGDPGLEQDKLSALCELGLATSLP